MSQIPLPGWRNLCVVPCTTVLVMGSETFALKYTFFGIVVKFLINIGVQDISWIHNSCKINIVSRSQKVGAGQKIFLELNESKLQKSTKNHTLT